MTQLAYTPHHDTMFKMIFGDARDISILTRFLQATLNLPAEDQLPLTIRHRLACESTNTGVLPRGA